MTKLNLLLSLLILAPSHAFVGPTKIHASITRIQATRSEGTILLENETTFASTAVEVTQQLEPQQLQLLQVRQQIEIDVQEVKIEEAKVGTEEDNWLAGTFWRGSIIVLCALWASNFPAAKMIMAEPGVDSGIYALTRFSIAALALLPGSIVSIRKGSIDWETAKGAAICGSWVAFGYLGQTLGLMTTTASKSCVICSMHCVFVAAIAEYTRVASSNGSKFNISKLLPALVAVVGVAIIELKGSGGAPNTGDFLSFAQPIGFGMGYLQLEQLMHKRPEAALPVSAIKLAVVAMASLVMYELQPLASSTMTDWSFRIPDLSPILASNTALAGVAYTGLITTALALWVESNAFKRVPATDASIILATEPIFAAGTAAAFLGETFGSSDYVGASLIVGACVIAILQDDKSPEEDTIYDVAFSEDISQKK
eukprot:CAMPEP_0197826034 /NCGR_PEP_ID=MMETSP1437-20131217/3045_1 /TAXON_ID=49252 ORGANISM="Eucampia antarctica, Strain CCMP1452" /NCGR_SAMPLE_ID=MMETSP1437 /ASSEMBLY_ACC=CAM_ASM_001096 /LENGTH=425 /DNA_ID=CAMNT_0043426287 /DNA_START=281 /DNA_END=1558 /DNA_ORIENTATION=+